MAKVAENRVGASYNPGEPDPAEAGFTAAEICLAYKVAWQDFIGGKTNRKALEAATKHLDGMLSARRQYISERDRLTSQRCERFYLN